MKRVDNVAKRRSVLTMWLREPTILPWHWIWEGIGWGLEFGTWEDVDVILRSNPCTELGADTDVMSFGDVGDRW